MAGQPLAQVWLRLGRILPLAAFLGVFGLSLGDAVAELLPVCSWPFQVTGQGLLNVATPDTNSTYWVMPLDTHRWPKLILHGEYPEARYFSIVTYNANGTLADHLADADIMADAGSTNPFADPTATEPHGYPVHYTLTIGGDTASAGNHLLFGPSRLAFIVYRLVVPDHGVNREGGGLCLICARIPWVPLDNVPLGCHGHTLLCARLAAIEDIKRLRRQPL